MSDADLQRMRTMVAILNSLPRSDATALLDEVYRLRAALAPLHDQLRRFLTASTEYSRCGLFLDGVQAEALARAALDPPADESNR
jgi:hypothetical protein